MILFPTKTTHYDRADKYLVGRGHKTLFSSSYIAVDFGRKLLRESGLRKSLISTDSTWTPASLGSFQSVPEFYLIYMV